MFNRFLSRDTTVTANIHNCGYRAAQRSCERYGVTGIDIWSARPPSNSWNPPDVQRGWWSRCKQKLGRLEVLEKGARAGWIWLGMTTVERALYYTCKHRACGDSGICDGVLTMDDVPEAQYVCDLLIGQLTKGSESRRLQSSQLGT